MVRSFCLVLCLLTWSLPSPQCLRCEPMQFSCPQPLSPAPHPLTTPLPYDCPHFCVRWSAGSGPRGTGKSRTGRGRPEYAAPLPPPPPSSGHYATLGVRSNATTAEVRGEGARSGGGRGIGGVGGGCQLSIPLRLWAFCLNTVRLLNC